MRHFIFVWFVFLLAPCWAELPFAQAGLSREQAAAHLLSRFSYGAQPGEVDRVARMGLERWFERQLQAGLPDSELDARLARLRTTRLSQHQILTEYPPPGMLLRRAREEGVEFPDRQKDRRAFRKALLDYQEKMGARPHRQLVAEAFANKLWRARYSQNQLHEVMSDFWFNHLYVSVSDNQARPLVGHYEDHVIRRHALTSFESLLSASARHPAMLFYLDNASSSAAPEATTSLDVITKWMDESPRLRRFERQMSRRKKGVNENYARELLELHTLGVNGGYGQKDVEELARILTGWLAIPPQLYLRVRAWNQEGQRLGLVLDELFLFASPLHDAEPKSLLGVEFPAGAGMEEGERALRMLASHPSTAEHLSRKLAIRFVSDDPPETLVKRLAKSYRENKGEVKPWLRTLVRSPEFWQARGQKVKTPFELLLSAARATDCELIPSRPLFNRLSEMGQPPYGYQAPTGFPDQADHWISSSTLLSRMNFGLDLALGKLPGTIYSPQHILPRGTDKRAVLSDLAERLLPGRNPEPSVELLLRTSANDSSASRGRPRKLKPRQRWVELPGLRPGTTEIQPDQELAARLLGLLLGSPEFQRR